MSCPCSSVVTHECLGVANSPYIDSYMAANDLRPAHVSQQMVATALAMPMLIMAMKAVTVIAMLMMRMLPTTIADGESGDAGRASPLGGATVPAGRGDGVARGAPLVEA